jgi:hypothetical protein
LAKTRTYQTSGEGNEKSSIKELAEMATIYSLLDVSFGEFD